MLITFLSLRKKSRVYDERKPELTWQRTLDLGNPIKPWTRTYSQYAIISLTSFFFLRVFQIPLSTFGLISLEDVMKAMRPARLVAYIENGVYFGIIAILLGFGCIPAVFTLTDFTAWVNSRYNLPSKTYSLLYLNNNNILTVLSFYIATYLFIIDYYFLYFHEILLVNQIFCI